MLRIAPSNADRRILVVDDDPQICEIVCELLLGQNYQVQCATKASAALQMSESWQPNLIILDISLPEMDGLEVLKKIKAQNPYTSVILFSGQRATEDLVKGLDAGGDDFISKPFKIEELLARVRSQLRIRDLTEQLLSANVQLRELVDTDDLTGLYNMRSLYSRLDYEMERGRRFNRTVCVVMMDLDYFKQVNDTNDHLFGSFVLAEVGKLIKNTIRSVDIAARYGGDEFLIVLTEIDRDGAIQFCNRLRKIIEGQTFDNGHSKMKITASIGFAITDPNGSAVETKHFVRLADKALYDAKRNGRNMACYYDLAASPELQTSIPETKKKTG